MCHEIPITTFLVFNHAVDVSNSNDSADDVQQAEKALPVPVAQHLIPQTTTMDSDMEGGSDEHKEAEDGELKEKADEHNSSSTVYSILSVRSCQHNASHCLNKEAKYIASNKDSGKPCGAYDRQLVKAGSLDDALKKHVDGSSKEDRGKEDEECLNNVSCPVIDIRVPVYPCEVTNDFDFRVSVSMYEDMWSGT